MFCLNLTSVKYTILFFRIDQIKFGDILAVKCPKSSCHEYFNSLYSKRKLHLHCIKVGKKLSYILDIMLTLAYSVHSLQTFLQVLGSNHFKKNISSLPSCGCATVCNEVMLNKLKSPINQQQLSLYTDNINYI